MTLLQTIIDRKRAAVERCKQRLPEDKLRELTARAPPRRDFASALLQPGPNIIAEVKRASPSAGVLRPDIASTDWSPEGLAMAYAEGGARCVSVLTETAHFWGSPDYLGAVRAAIELPLLRKDFIVDPYQVDESCWLGADAILLIVAVLDDDVMRACAKRAVGLGMSVLVEVHADDELARALAIEGAVIGVNHRDLQTFELDMQRAIRLRERVPAERPLVAESGLSSPAEIRRFLAAGIQSFLVGESVAKADDPATAVRELRQA